MYSDGSEPTTLTLGFYHRITVPAGTGPGYGLKFTHPPSPCTPQFCYIFPVHTTILLHFPTSYSTCEERTLVHDWVCTSFLVLRTLCLFQVAGWAKTNHKVKWGLLGI